MRYIGFETYEFARREEALRFTEDFRERGITAFVFCPVGASYFWGVRVSRARAVPPYSVGGTCAA
jgi:hypothetical protein